MRFLLILIIFGLGVGLGYYVGTGGSIEGALKNFNVPEKVVDAVKRVQPEFTEFNNDAPSANETVGQIPGVWQSIEDPKFTREFRVDGTVFDRYEGKPDATVEGQWHVVMSSDEKLPFTMKAGVTYLVIEEVEEVLYFSVNKLTADELELVYQSGEVLKFKRVR